MFITAVPITKLFAWGGWELCVCLLLCVFITAVPITKLFAVPIINLFVAGGRTAAAGDYECVFEESFIFIFPTRFY